MLCWYCGKWNPEEANRCDDCGLVPARPEGVPNLSSGIPVRARLAAAVFALFTGVLGLHKFYLGYTLQGLIIIVSTFALIVLMSITPYAAIGKLVIMGVTVTEGILYLTQSDERFINTYVLNRKAWF